jgi:L-2-hydroxyglutarate oxidase LhgO
MTMPASPSPVKPDQIDVLVIGAGVVGLACARALAQAGLEVVIAERETHFGTGVSSRSSEVIHAGLYNAPGSLKSRLCVRGGRLLVDYCESRGIAHRLCGKLLVATRAADIPALQSLAARARDNGVQHLQWLTRAQATALESELECEAALLSPASGIVDSHGLMSALLADAQAAGALLAVTSGMASAQREGDGWRVATRSAGLDGEFELQARWIINSAGLDAQAVAAAMVGFPASAIPRRYLAKGNYFSLGGRSPFSRLIYPMPVDGGLGVHLTLDLAGQARFGPDVEWLSDERSAQLPGAELDYAVDASRAAAFAREIRRYWPRLADEALTPAYSGIRPKLSGAGAASVDFRIDGPAQHGCHGVVQLFGIESPGLTAALAIAEEVAAIVGAGPGPSPALVVDPP